MSITLDLEKMTTVEKLRLMEDLWQDLAASETEINSPAWHGDVLAERLHAFSSGQETPIDWEIAKQQLRDELR
jgi:putative addiction module component (TIGR02574 family)